MALHPQLGLDAWELLFDELADRIGDAVSVIGRALATIVAGVIADSDLVLRVVTLDCNAQRECLAIGRRTIDVPDGPEGDCSGILAVHRCRDRVDVWSFDGDLWASRVEVGLGNGVLDFGQVDHFYL